VGCVRISVTSYHHYALFLFSVKMSMPVSDVDPTIRSIKPDGLPLAILVLSCVFLGLSIMAVSARTYIRIAKGAFGLDDKFMVAGCVSSLPE
jgi:hypothetical protein